jgi:two-component system, cell cycle response regulator
MKGSEFLLGVLGLNRVERMTVSSVCSLTHSRARGYTVLPPERNNEADIMLLNLDDSSACTLWQSARSLRPRPVITLSRDPQNGQLIASPYTLPRTNFASRLIKLLDQITIREFKFLPEVVVSDTDHSEKPIGISVRNESTATNRSRALVVDDSAVARNKISALLGLHGISADMAPDAERAIEMLQAHRYDVVLLDVMMPGMDGYAACRKMRGLYRNPPPIVMLTGRDSPFDKIRGVMAGCSCYLTKPITGDELSKVVHDYIRPSAVPAGQRA